MTEMCSAHAPCFGYGVSASSPGQKPWGASQERTIPCLRGCVHHDQHLEDCDADDCHGCEPRKAVLGRLCARCAYRLEDWLSNDVAEPGWYSQPAGQRREIRSSLAWAAHCVDDAIDRGIVGIAYDGDRIGYTKEPPAPVDLARVDLLRDLDDTMSSWLEAWCSHRGLRGPDVYELRYACRYLASWLEELATWEPVRDMWDELSLLMSRAHALAPWRQQARACDGVPCPDCGQPNLVVYDGDDLVTCRRCGATLHRDEYTRWTRIIADEARPKPLSYWASRYGRNLRALQRAVQRAELEPDDTDRNGRKLYREDTLAACLRIA